MSQFHGEKDDADDGKEVEAIKVKNGEHDHDYNLHSIIYHIGGAASSAHYATNCKRTRKNIMKTGESYEESLP